MRFLFALALLAFVSVAQAQTCECNRPSCTCVPGNQCGCLMFIQAKVEPPKVITTHETGGPLILGTSPMVFQLKPVEPPKIAQVCPPGTVCPLPAPKLVPGATIPLPMPQRPVLVAVTPQARRGPLQTIRDNIAERRQGRAYARCTK